MTRCSREEQALSKGEGNGDKNGREEKPTRGASGEKRSSEGGSVEGKYRRNILGIREDAPNREPEKTHNGKAAQIEEKKKRRRKRERSLQPWSPYFEGGAARRAIQRGR